MMLEPRQGAKVVARWWRELQPREVAGQSLSGDRAALAKLRRAGTVMQACMIPATLELCRQMQARPSEMDRVALVAAVLAHVREDAAPRFAAQLGEPPEQKPFSAPRFQRLIETTEPDIQLAAFRRAIAQVKRRASVLDLAESLLDWNDRRRQRWLYDYYHAQDPGAPNATNPPSPNTETTA